MAKWADVDDGGGGGGRAAADGRGRAAVVGDNSGSAGPTTEGLFNSGSGGGRGWPERSPLVEVVNGVRRGTRTGASHVTRDIDGGESGRRPSAVQPLLPVPSTPRFGSALECGMAQGGGSGWRETGGGGLGGEGGGGGGGCDGGGVYDSNRGESADGGDGDGVYDYNDRESVGRRRGGDLRVPSHQALWVEGGMEFPVSDEMVEPAKAQKYGSAKRHKSSTETGRARSRNSTKFLRAWT